MRCPRGIPSLCPICARYGRHGICSPPLLKLYYFFLASRYNGHESSWFMNWRFGMDRSMFKRTYRKNRSLTLLKLSHCSVFVYDRC
jgi:hypothetical protein